MRYKTDKNVGHKKAATIALSRCFSHMSYLDNLKHIFYLITVFVQRKKKGRIINRLEKRSKSITSIFWSRPWFFWYQENKINDINVVFLLSLYLTFKSFQIFWNFCCYLVYFLLKLQLWSENLHFAGKKQSIRINGAEFFCGECYTLNHKKTIFLLTVWYFYGKNPNNNNSFFEITFSHSKNVTLLICVVLQFL